MKIILWFASTLCEETIKISGPSIQMCEASSLGSRGCKLIRYCRYGCFDRVSANVRDAVDILRYSVDISATGDMSLAESGLKCFHVRKANLAQRLRSLMQGQTWVMYAQRGWVDKGSDLQTLRPLIPLAMMALQNEQMCEAGAELFTDILNQFPAFLTDNDSRTLSVFLSSDNARNSILRLTQGEFDQEATSLAKLLLAYGEAFVQDLAQDPDNVHLGKVLNQLLGLLQRDEYADFEDEFYSQVLEFWTTYTDFIIDSLFGCENDRPPWMNTAQQRIEGVIGVCLVKIQMPSPEVAVTWDADVKANFKNFRKDVQDLLQSSYALLGLNVFGKFAELALQFLGNRAWLPFEASLFCLNGLADSVAEDDSADGILSKLFNSSMFADMASPIEDIPPKTRQTAVTLVSNYTDFFERNNTYLPGMLNFLFLSLKSPALAHASAKAIFCACSLCRVTLRSELSTFLQQYETILTWESTDASTKQKLVGAIGAIIGASPRDEDKVAPLEQLIQSIEVDVDKCIRAFKTRDTERYQEYGINALKSLVSLGKSLQAPDDVVIDLELETRVSPFWKEGPGAFLQQRVIKILETITALMKTNSDAIEEACQTLRIGRKEVTGGLFVFPLEVSIRFILACGLDTARLDYVLDTAAICLSRRTREAESALYNAANAILHHVLGLINLIGSRRRLCLAVLFIR